MTDQHGGVRPYQVAVSDDAIADLQQRLGATRWPEALAGDGWTHGTDHDSLQRICRYWANEFDWHRQEAELNRYPHVVAEIDGTRVHAVYAASNSSASLPIVLLHGWPSTISEFRHLISPLINPVAHGALAGDAFDVVAVSLPGYGFSGPTPSFEWDADRMARAIKDLLHRLGIRRYGVFGTDAGAYVASSLAALDHDNVAGLHLHIGGVRLAAQARTLFDVDEFTEVERTALDDLARYETTDSGYGLLNGTKPHTLAYALTDSPVGQAAWIIEKFQTWTDSTDARGAASPFGSVSLDDILTIVSTYWFTKTAGSAARFYAATGAAMAQRGVPAVQVPTGCAAFPGDIVTPSRRWAEQTYPNIVHWTDMQRGGHFSALEVPDLLGADLRTFFRPLR